MLKMVFVSGVMVEDLTRPFGNRLLCNKKASAFKLRLFSLVIRSGLEPETYCLEGSCSIQLS